MQKKLIALAVAGLMSGAAFAQSNVTVYGLLDLGFVRATGAGQDLTAINSGVNDGSRLGFKGEEALGNGIKAVFNLEYQLYIDKNQGVGANGANGFNTRQSFVGLTGNFGTVVGGRLKAPGDAITAGMDSTDQSNTFSALAPMNSFIGATSHAVLNNAVAYVSPTVNGLTFLGAYSTGGAVAGDGVPSAKDPERIIGFRVSYDMGPLSLAYAHHRLNDLANVAGNDQREHIFGATYDLGVAKLFTTYQTVKNVAKAKALSLGATVPVGNDLLRVQYALGNPNGSNNDATGYGIRFDHNLSKRTFAYVGYGRIATDSGAGASAPSFGDGLVGGVAGRNSSGYGFGIEHAF